MQGSCANCGLYTRLNAQKLCKSCFLIDDQLLQHAREILRDEGRLSINELAEAISIPPTRIFSWIEQGRLSPPQLKSTCPFCGEDLFGIRCICMKESKSVPISNFNERSSLIVRVQNKKYWI